MLLARQKVYTGPGTLPGALGFRAALVAVDSATVFISRVQHVVGVKRQIAPERRTAAAVKSLRTAGKYGSVFSGVEILGSLGRPGGRAGSEGLVESSAWLGTGLLIWGSG